jgi:hypothetical protein
LLNKIVIYYIFALSSMSTKILNQGFLKNRLILFCKRDFGRKVLKALESILLVAHR